MKRCPECGREYDNTMSFCLDDGAELLYVPASDESAPPSSSGTGSRLQAAPPASLTRRGRSLPLSWGLVGKA